MDVGIPFRCQLAERINFMTMLDETLLNGPMVLENLANSSSPRGISELARDLGQATTSTHRVLRTLLSKGYVEQNEDSCYRLTVKVWGLGGVRRVPY